jgi:hypothetical protein
MTIRREQAQQSSQQGLFSRMVITRAPSSPAIRAWNLMRRAGTGAQIQSAYRYNRPQTKQVNLSLLEILLAEEAQWFDMDRPAND